MNLSELLFYNITQRFMADWKCYIYNVYNVSIRIL